MTLEQCKQLEKWGMPQGTKRWQRCYASRGGTIDTFCLQDLSDIDTLLVTIPDLEQLLEFAKTVVPAIALSDIGERGWYVYQKGTPIPKDAIDHDPKVAVYKLLEKILGADDQPKQA